MKSTHKFFLFIILILLFWLIGRYFQFDIDYYRGLLSSLPLFLSGIIFVGLYVGLTTLIWVGPKDVLRVAAAFLFGATISTLFVWIGELGNAFCLFHLSRRLGRDFVVEKFKLERHKVDYVKKDSSPLGLIALRINPLIPFRLMDLGFGLTKVRFKQYFWVALLISPFRIFWLQYILAGMGETLLTEPSILITYLTDNPFILKYSAIYFGIIVLITVLAFALRPSKPNPTPSQPS